MALLVGLLRGLLRGLLVGSGLAPKTPLSGPLSGALCGPLSGLSCGPLSGALCGTSVAVAATFWNLWLIHVGFSMAAALELCLCLVARVLCMCVHESFSWLTVTSSSHTYSLLARALRSLSPLALVSAPKIKKSF